MFAEEEVKPEENQGVSEAPQSPGLPGDSGQEEKQEEKVEVEEILPQSPAQEEIIEPVDTVGVVAEEKLEKPEEPAPTLPPPEKKWYVIQTFSGQEEKVKKNLEHSIEEMNMGHKILKVLVPEEETVEVRGEKRVEVKKKMFPGYIFIEMLLDEEAWYVIRSIPGVAKFIGTKTMPTPVLDREMQRVLKQIGVKGEKLEVNFEVGETVRVISGPFRGYTGTINEINIDKGKLKVLINIFGRDTPMEVNFEHAQKIV